MARMLALARYSAGGRPRGPAALEPLPGSRAFQSLDTNADIRSMPSFSFTVTEHDPESWREWRLNHESPASRASV
jgi:hypothetical protein